MKVVIDENTEDYVIKNILTESFYPTTEKVLLVKDYLDKNFAKTESDDIGKDGYPVKIKTAVLLSSNGQPLKTFQARELLMMLDDKFQKMITKEDDRKKFFKQIIRDWFNNKISKEGILSVNLLK